MPWGRDRACRPVYGRQWYGSKGIPNHGLRIPQSRNSKADDVLHVGEPLGPGESICNHDEAVHSVSAQRDGRRSMGLPKCNGRLINGSRHSRINEVPNSRVALLDDKLAWILDAPIPFWRNDLNAKIRMVRGRQPDEAICCSSPCVIRIEREDHGPSSVLTKNLEVFLGQSRTSDCHDVIDSVMPKKDGIQRTLDDQERVRPSELDTFEAEEWRDRCPTEIEVSDLGVGLDRAPQEGRHMPVLIAPRDDHP